MSDDKKTTGKVIWEGHTGPVPQVCNVEHGGYVIAGTFRCTDGVTPPRVMVTSDDGIPGVIANGGEFTVEQIERSPDNDPIDGFNEARAAAGCATNEEFLRYLAQRQEDRKKIASAERGLDLVRQFVDAIANGKVLDYGWKKNTEYGEFVSHGDGFIREKHPGNQVTFFVVVEVPHE